MQSVLMLLTSGRRLCYHPVSYTHLDVYKRQYKDSDDSEELPSQVYVSGSKAGQMYGFKAVSYTHLDVYKRQVYLSLAVKPFVGE